MPPSAVKTIKEVIFWQYAKIISASAGIGKQNYGMIMSTYKKLCVGEIIWSSSVREYLRERENNHICIYCGQEDKLTIEHIFPRSRGGEDITDNVVMVCKHCNSSKGNKGLYEWLKLSEKDNHHRIAEGKYLKYIYMLHEKSNTLDNTILDLCPCRLKQKCIEEGTEQKLSVYCVEGCIAFHGSPKEEMVVVEG